jgi:hypothetical protein
MADNVIHISTMWVLDCHELQKATGIDWRFTEFGQRAENGSYQHLACDNEMVEALQEDINYFINEDCEYCTDYKVYKNTLTVINYIRESLAITDEVLINVYW